MALTAADVVRNTTTLTSLPDNYTKLTTAIDRSTSSAKEIADVVNRDTGLAARLLRIVNSAFYAFPTRVETVSRAVTIVGTTQLKDLALATSVVRMFSKIPTDLVNMESFWRHSLACGVIARTIADARREANVERFFLAGLLHDVGKLLLYMKQPGESRTVLERCKDEQSPQGEVEKQVLGFTHGDVGFELLKSWKLSESLQEPVRNHHNPGRSTTYPRETAAVHVADWLSSGLELGNAGADVVPALSTDAFELLSIRVEDMPGLLDKAEAQYDEVVEIVLG